MSDPQVPRSDDWRVYVVTLKAILGETEQHKVLSRLGPNKAVAMAVEVHFLDAEAFWDRTMWPIYSVEIEDLGPAPRDPEGGPVGDYLEDRDEF